MVSDRQVRELRMHRNKGLTIEVAAMKSGMSEKTARKYLHLRKTPSQCARVHTWRTRDDPFREVWEDIRKYLEGNPGLEARTLFEDLQRKWPGQFSDGQLRTLQRRVKQWRATEGPGKEVYFPQEHQPGKMCESDFTYMTELGVTINNQMFPHLLYHFVLTYSNWETGTVCFSESYESLSGGLQNALWELGGVPEYHRTDRLTAAINKECNREQFTRRYTGLLRHYGLKARPTQAGKPHEKGDIEQRHYRLKRALDQALLLRGSRDFSSREEYQEFIRNLFRQICAGRQQRLSEEIPLLKSLPTQRVDDCKKFRVKVGPSSTIRVLHNTYSVNSRLIGEWVDVRVYAEYLEVWCGQKKMETVSRIRGEYKYAINYRHIIDWLVRKPGAFEQYRYRQDLFPATTFRLVYDRLRQETPARADKQYLGILHLAARRSERDVENVLRHLLEKDTPITPDAVCTLLETQGMEKTVPDIRIPTIPLSVYDVVLNRKEVLECRP